MNNPPTAPLLRAAHAVFAYLATTDARPVAPVDAVLGFGMFDLSLPVFCGDLYRQGQARQLIFTGGIGAGTGNLGQPEADAWRDALSRAHPDIPSGALIIENQSTNTTENIVFTAALLARDHPALTFGDGLHSVLVVASPSRLRRVGLALQKLAPSLRVVRQLPPTDFAREQALYAGQGLDYIDHLTGELDRIVAYPARGWIAAEPLPPDIAAAHRTLRERPRPAST